MAAMGQDGLRGLSATTCRWLLHLNSSRSTELNGSFSASKSAAEISVPGQLLTFGLSALRTAERPVCSGTCRKGNAT